MALTVLIVDDHAGFRGFARRLLEADGFTVVGEAGDGTSALAAVDDQRPEIVLLDIVLPDIDGCAVADRLAQKRPALMRVGLRRASLDRMTTDTTVEACAQRGSRNHNVAAVG